LTKLSLSAQNHQLLSTVTIDKLLADESLNVRTEALIYEIDAGKRFSSDDIAKYLTANRKNALFFGSFNVVAEREVTELLVRQYKMLSHEYVMQEMSFDPSRPEAGYAFNSLTPARPLRRER
jgi:hypothetical protein